MGVRMGTEEHPHRILQNPLRTNPYKSVQIRTNPYAHPSRHVWRVQSTRLSGGSTALTLVCRLFFEGMDLTVHDRKDPQAKVRNYPRADTHLLKMES